jgi:hypothetical protein
VTPELLDRFNRVDALQAALRDGRPRPDKLTVWYCASALLDKEGAPEEVAAQVREKHRALIEQIGKSRAPTGEMRWAYAAMFAARDISVETFKARREAIRETWKSSKAFKKTGRPHAGGSRAALVLAVCGLEPKAGAKAFFEMKVQLNPPCWRSSPEITDLFCAAHAAKGDDPRSVAQARERATEVFKSDRRANGHKHTGAKACALFEAEPRTVLRSFHALDEARKQIKKLRHRVTRDMVIEWAAQGLEPADLETMAELVQMLPGSLSGDSTGRARMAHLLLTHGQVGNEFGEVAALASIMAAQTAAMVAGIAATTAATSAAASAGE